MDNLGGTAIGDQVDQVYDTIYSVTNCSYVEFSESGEYHDATETATITGSLSYNQDYIRAKPKSYTFTDGENPYEYVLEWGITSPLTANDGLRDWQQNADQYSALVLPLALAARGLRTALADLSALAAGGGGTPAGRRGYHPVPPSPLPL